MGWNDKVRPTNVQFLFFLRNFLLAAKPVDSNPDPLRHRLHPAIFRGG
jgi:hypothetical protein